MSDKNTKSAVLPESGYVRADVVRQVLGISKGALFQAVNSGIFPEPIRITKKTVAWDVDEVRTYIERCKAKAMAERKQRMAENGQSEQFYAPEEVPADAPMRP